MWTSSQVQKDIRITHLNQWPTNLINKYIHYKSNVLSTFSWLEPVLTPALDIGIAKSGSDLVHSPPSHMLCLTPCVKAWKSFHSVLPCLVMMYHQTNFSIFEDLVVTIVALTLNVAKWYFWMILWLMMMHHHTKFEWSEIFARYTIVRHHVNHPRRNDCNLFHIYSFVIKQALKIRWNVVIYQVDEKESSLVSVVNKSQYCDIHTEDTVGNIWDTDNFLCVWNF